MFAVCADERRGKRLIGLSETRRVCVVDITWLMLVQHKLIYKLGKDETNGPVSSFNLCGLRDNIINHVLTCLDLYKPRNDKVSLKTTATNHRAMPFRKAIEKAFDS